MILGLGGDPWAARIHHTALWGRLRRRTWPLSSEAALVRMSVFLPLISSTAWLGRPATSPGIAVALPGRKTSRCSVAPNASHQNCVDLQTSAVIEDRSARLSR